MHNGQPAAPPARLIIPIVGLPQKVLHTTRSPANPARERAGSPANPARERAGYLHEGRLRGLPEPAQAGLVDQARPFTGRAIPFAMLAKI